MFRRSGQQSMGYSPESFREALKEVWFAPGRFFKRLDPEGGPIRPTIFASLVLYLNLLLDAVLQAFWLGEYNLSLVYAPFVGLLVALVLAPLLISGLTALTLVILDGAPSRRNFGPVYRAFGYASGIGIVVWIPYGPLLAIPYGAAVATIAVKETLGLGWRRAAAAALIPLGAVFLIVLLLVGPTEAYGFLINPAGS
ncbi:MAG TPA: YIP1 family protein [Rubrobacteraceae bacterium]|nr:YIP1 family protein [Rubrobacteraceae bacterium]